MDQNQAREHLGKFVDRATQAWRDGDVDLAGMRAMLEDAAELLADACGGAQWRVNVAPLPASDTLGLEVVLGDGILKRTVAPYKMQVNPGPSLLKAGVVIEEIPMFFGVNYNTAVEADAPLRERAQGAPPRGAAVVALVADRLGIGEWEVEEVLQQMGGQDAALRALSVAVAQADQPNQMEALVRELSRQVTIRRLGRR